MKFTKYTLKTFMQKPSNYNLTAFLVFGVDKGLITETFNQISSLIVPDVRDVFNVVNMSTEEVKSSVSRLYDEASTYALGSGKRLIRVVDADDSVTESLALFLKEYNGENFIVLSAGDLSKTSKLRKLTETSEKAGTFACYPDDNDTLKSLILTESKKEGKTLEPQAISYLADNLGADRALARRELEKLFVYLHDEKQISEDMIKPIIGDSSATSISDVVYACADGNIKMMNKTLRRILAEDDNAPVGVIRTALYHFRNLHIARTKIDKGVKMDEAVKVYPPIHFSKTEAFRKQVLRWQKKDIEKILRYLVDLEIKCKTTGNVPEIIVEEGLLRICMSIK